GFQSFAVVRFLLLFQLANQLPCVRESISLTVESFIAMATNTTAILEKVAPKIERRSVIKHAVVLVALYATGLCVLTLIERMQPERIKAMSLDDCGRRATVASVTCRATEAVRCVNLK